MVEIRSHSEIQSNLKGEFRGIDPSEHLNGDLKDRLLEFLIKTGFASDDVYSHIYNPPKTHEGSQAYYYADYYLGEHRILLGLMPLNSFSTTHYHESPIIEEYHPLAGQLYLNGEPIPKEGLIINPYMVHQASAREIPAVTLLVMRNAGKVPEHLQHIRLKS